MLDAANKLAAAIENISNEFKLQINGTLTVVEFAPSERHRSARALVNSYKDKRASGVDHQAFAVYASYSATK